MLSLLLVPNAAALNETMPVPDATFQGLTGTQVRLADFKGKVVLLNFWGTWCVPCLREIPELVRVSEQFQKKGFAVLGIAVDSGRPDDIRAFMAEHRMTYTILIGELGFIKKAFRVVGFPTSILIDRQGMIRKRYVGPQSEEVFKRDVEPLL
jgi:peroxiredoxin